MTMGWAARARISTRSLRYCLEAASEQYPSTARLLEASLGYCSEAARRRRGAARRGGPAARASWCFKSGISAVQFRGF